MAAVSQCSYRHQNLHKLSLKHTKQSKFTSYKLQDAEGSFESLNGEYQLKVDELDKPDPNCVDSCVYTRRDDPEMEEYCFSQTQYEAASVLPSSCPAISTLASFGTSWEDTSSVSGVSTSIVAPGTTAAAMSVLDLREETEKQIADLDALINDVDSSPVLKTELEKLKNLLSGLSGSLDTVLEGGRVKRSATMTCSDLTVIITAHEYVTTLLDDILNHMNAIGTNTGNTDLDNFIATAIEMFSQIDVKAQLQLFKGIQAQQCGALTSTSAAASTSLTSKDPST